MKLEPDVNDCTDTAGLCTWMVLKSELLVGGFDVCFCGGRGDVEDFVRVDGGVRPY